MLIVGTWPDGSPSPPDKTICYDHSRPPSQRNKHLLGMSTLLEDRVMEAVVNVDFWRFLMPDDLNRLIAESLRVAQQLILVQTHGASGPEDLMSSCATMDFVADMLTHHRSATTSSIDGADVLRVTISPAGACQKFRLKSDRQLCGQRQLRKRDHRHPLRPEGQHREVNRGSW